MLLTDEDGNSMSRELDGFDEEDEMLNEGLSEGGPEDVEDKSVMTAAQFRQVRQTQYAKELQQMRQQTEADTRSSSAWKAQQEVGSKVNEEAVARTSRKEGYYMALGEYYSSKMRSSTQEGQERSTDEGRGDEGDECDESWDDDSDEDEDESSNAPHVGPFSDFFAHYHDEQMVPLSLGISQGVYAHISAAADAAAKGSEDKSDEDANTQNKAPLSAVGGLFGSSSQSSFSQVQGKKKYGSGGVGNSSVTFAGQGNRGGGKRADLHLDLETDAGRAGIDALSTDTSMELVDLSCYGIGDRYGQALSKGLKQLGQLQGPESKPGKSPMQQRRLLRQGTGLVNGKPQTAAQANSKVIELRLKQNRLTDSSMTPLLQGIEKLGSIAAADLSQNQFGVRSVVLLRGILESFQCRLHTLVLDQCRLGSNGGGAEMMGLTHFSDKQGGSEDGASGGGVAAFQDKAHMAKAAAAGDSSSSATVGDIGAGAATSGDSSNGSARTGTATANSVAWLTSLAEALSMNRSLTRLSLQRNEIGSEGAEQLAKALGTNGSLASLDLSWNNIRGVGARKLALALACKNGTVRDLSLAFNSLGSSLGTEATRRRVCISMDPPDSMKQEMEAKKKEAAEKDAKKGKKGKAKEKGKDKGKGAKGKKKGEEGEGDGEVERSKWENWHENRKAQVRELRRCKATSTGRAGGSEVRRILGVDEMEAAEQAAVEVAFQAREKVKRDAEIAKKGLDQKKKQPAAKKGAPKQKGPPPPDPELDQYRLGSSAVEWAAVLVMNESLTHLDFSHNAFDQLDCELLAEGVLNNRNLIGLHMTGNSAVVDHKGFIVPMELGIMDQSKIKLPVPSAEDVAAAEKAQKEKAAKEKAVKEAEEKAAAEAAKAAAEKAAKKGKKGKKGGISAKEIKRREKQRVKDEEAERLRAEQQIKNEAAFAKLKLMTAARDVQRDTRLAMEAKGHFGLLHVSIDGAISADRTGGGMITSDEQACCWRCHGYREHRFHAPPPEELLNELHIGFGDSAGFAKPLSQVERAHLIKTTPPPTIHLMCDGWRADTMEWDAVDGCYACYRMLPPGIHRYYFTYPLTGERWFNPLEPHSKLAGLPVPVCNTLQFTEDVPVDPEANGRGSIDFGDEPLTMVRFNPDGSSPDKPSAKRGTKRSLPSSTPSGASAELKFDFALPRERGWASKALTGSKAGAANSTGVAGTKEVTSPLKHEARTLTEEEKWELAPRAPEMMVQVGRGRTGSVLPGGSGRGSPPTPGLDRAGSLESGLTAGMGSGGGDKQPKSGDTVPELPLTAGAVTRHNSHARLQNVAEDRRWSKMSTADSMASDSPRGSMRSVGGRVAGGMRRQSSMKSVIMEVAAAPLKVLPPPLRSLITSSSVLAHTNFLSAPPSQLPVKCQDCGEKTGKPATNFCEHPECGKKRCDSCSCEEHQLAILHTMENMKPQPLAEGELGKDGKEKGATGKGINAKGKGGKGSKAAEEPFSSKYVEKKGSCYQCDSCGKVPSVHIVMCKHSQCVGKITCINCFDADHGWAWGLLKNDRVWRGRLLRHRAKQRLKGMIRTGVELVNALDHHSFKSHSDINSGGKIATAVPGTTTGTTTKNANPGHGLSGNVANSGKDASSLGSYLDEPHAYTAGLDRDWARMVKKGSVRQLVERWSAFDNTSSGRGGDHDSEMEEVKKVFLARYPQLVRLFRYLAATPCVQYAQPSGKTSQPSTPITNLRMLGDKGSAGAAEDDEDELEDIDGASTGRSGRSSARRTPTPSAAIAAAAAVTDTKDPAWSLLQAGPNPEGPFSVPLEQWLWICERCELVVEGDDSSFVNREAMVNIFNGANRVGAGGTGLNAESSGKRDHFEVQYNSPKHMIRSEFLEALLRVAVNLYVRERHETTLPSCALEVLLDVDLFPSCAQAMIASPLSSPMFMAGSGSTSPFLGARAAAYGRVSGYAGREPIDKWGGHNSNIFRETGCYTQDVEVLLFKHRKALKAIYTRYSQTSEGRNQNKPGAGSGGGGGTPTAAPRMIAAGKKGGARHTIAQVKSSSPDQSGDAAKKPTSGKSSGPLIIRHRKPKEREVEFKMTVSQWLRLLIDAMLLSPEADAEAQRQRQHARSQNMDNGDAGSDTPPPRARRKKDNVSTIGRGLSLMQAQLAFVCSKIFVSDDMGGFHEAAHLSFEDFMEALCYLVGYFLADLPITSDYLDVSMEEATLAEKLSVLLEHLMRLHLQFA
jgi:Ran GTPase-activating protein (RanGAP) involved in mRNA processing and transport